MPKTGPILMFGNDRPQIGDPDRQMTMLAALWVEAELLSETFRDLEERVAKQDAWLNANRDHPLWNERVHHAWDVRKEHERATRKLHDIANAANRITEDMSLETRLRARDHIHAWAGTGNVGIHALAWNLVPDQSWLDDAYTEAETLRETVAVPF